MPRSTVLVACLALSACGAHRAGGGRWKAHAGEAEVVAAATRLFVCTDRRDWACVQEVFAPEVHFDMTSMGAPRATAMTSRQIADAWEAGLKPLAAVHHQAGNFQAAVRERDADLSCYGVAYHYLPNATGRNVRAFVGTYDLHLVRGEAGWRIDRFKFNLKFVDGNPDLEGSARR